MKVVETKCVSCEYRLVITEKNPRNQKPGFHPMCNLCGSPMVAISAQEVKDEC